MLHLLLLLVTAFIVSSVGWVYFIYFFSIGYGLSISALSVVVFAMFWHDMTLPATILCCVLFVYGIRLALYLFIRERRSSSYRKILYQPTNAVTKPLFVMFLIWISCSLLYVGQISPITFYLHNRSVGADVGVVWVWIGVAVACVGVVIEIVADVQKSAAKRVDAHYFVSTGLYRIVRFPNYFGEVMLWTGSFLVCFSSCCTVWQWIIATLGYVGIIYVMFSGARRLELRQQEAYGSMPEFREYVKRTPLILPLVPIYSVARHTWLKA